MKRLVSLLLVVLMICCSCGTSQETANIKVEKSQIRNIAELATLECYYHNVAKYEDDDTSGILFWKKDTRYWIEYSGVVKYGVDASKIKMKVNNDKVFITMPKAELQGVNIDKKTLNKKSYIVEEGTTPPQAKDQTEAIKDAQAEMRNEAKKDKSLFARAEDQAQVLIEKYVTNVGKIIGKNYKIEWED